MRPKAIFLAATAIVGGMTATDAHALRLAFDAAGDDELASRHATMAAETTADPYALDGPVKARVTNRRARLQCVPFARREAGLEIFGDANTWWAQAKDHFTQADRPSHRSIIVLRGYAGADRGHVAVVKEIVSDRVIIVDHANWMNRGEISRDVPVRDVSEEGDWSEVQVWNVRGRHWGGRTYNVQGFILNQLVEPLGGQDDAAQTTAGKATPTV